MSKQNSWSLHIAQHKWLLWIVAFIITILAAHYQRATGPTYPVRGNITIGNQEITFKLLRSETTDKNAPIEIVVPDTAIHGYIKFRRYKSHDAWSTQPMQRQGDKLVAALPKQPPAGKVMYYVYLASDGEEVSLTGDKPVILRYKGPVPLWILIPHIFFMFFAMFLASRTALEALDAQGNSKQFMKWTVLFFFIGGFILGPLVQKFAFGALWTGIPFGWDLTDNKTLIAMVGWLYAWWRNRGEHVSRGSILFAALLMFAVYLIPHSAFGSELDYTKLEAGAK